jgi:hypothetical protein
MFVVRPKIVDSLGGFTTKEAIVIGKVEVIGVLVVTVTEEMRSNVVTKEVIIVTTIEEVVFTGLDMTTEEVIAVCSVLVENTGNVCTIDVTMGEEAIQEGAKLVDEEGQVIIVENGSKLEYEEIGVKERVVKRFNGVEVSKLGLRSLALRLVLTVIMSNL